MITYYNFTDAIKDQLTLLMGTSNRVAPNFWQSRDVSGNPQAVTHEILNQSFRVDMISRDLNIYRSQIQPNLPWADRHFEMERASGEPKNPGTTWKEWPWGSSADTFRDENGQFDHSYAERFWPRWAGITEGGLTPDSIREEAGHQGIRFRYGDLEDVVKLLLRDPMTRQAVIPIFFPEDTGAVDGQRIPCTLFYHLIQRNNGFHMVYSIRSCDGLRHFQDDIYLAVRLMMWVLERLQQIDPLWKRVHPQSFTMHITSFHCFVGDILQLKKKINSLP